MSNYKLIDTIRLKRFKEKLLSILKFDSLSTDPYSTSTEFVDTITQENGKISATKKAITKASLNQQGIVQLNNTLTSQSTDQALTAAQGKALHDSILAMDFTSPGANDTEISFIDTVEQTDGKISATKKTIRSASTAQQGIVQLNNTLESDSTDQALTAAQGKALKGYIDGKKPLQKKVEATFDPNNTATECITNISQNENGVISATKMKISAVSLSGYATEDWVKDQGFLTSHQSLSGYATKDWVEEQGYKTSDAVSSVNGKTGVVTIDVPTKTSQLENDSKFLTSHQSLSGYATEEWVKSNFPTVVVCKSFDDLLDTIPEGGARNVMGIRIAGAFPSLSRPASSNILNFLVGATPTAIGVWTISRSGGSAINYTFEQAFGGGPAYVF